jgi:hypothetical protein
MTPPDVIEAVVDGRGMEPPEPFVRVMDALSVCPDGRGVLLLLSREPYPLYRALALNGFAHSVRHAADGTVEILSWRDPDHAGTAVV